MRVHMAETPIILDRARTWQQTSYFKPKGLWWGVGSAWEEWCRNQRWGLDRLRVSYRVEVDEGCLLKLGSLESLVGLLERYGVEKITGSGLRSVNWSVNWGAVAKSWGGVEFSPYSRGLAFSVEGLWWYSAIDVESGCVWDMGAVTGWERLEGQDTRRVASV